MGMIGMGNECYLYVNGISVSKPIWLHDTVCLSPAKSAIKWQEVMSLFENDIDFSIAVLCNPTIASQLHIIGDDTEHLIANAWNSQWDCVLLGALFNHNVMCNLQSDQPIEQIAKAEYIHITNYELRALLSDVYNISEEDESWLEKYYETAYKLLEKENFISFSKKSIYIIFGKKFAIFILNVFSILNTNIGKYFSGKILDSAIVGLLSAVGLYFIGSKYSLLFGVLVGFMNLIPYFGPVIGMTPVVIINLFYNPQIALFSLIYLLLVQQIEIAFIEPKIVGGQLGLSPFLTILAVTIGGGFFGIPGMILSVPIMGVLKIYIVEFVESKNIDLN